MKSLSIILCLVLLPVAAFALELDGAWSTGYGDLVLAQSGSRVTGTYYNGDGKLTGTLRGNKLTFTYRDSNDAGEGEFVFAADGKSFTGTWRAASGDGGAWNGERPGQSTTTTPAAGPVSFTGSYTTTYGAMLLAQAGSRVTGSYSYADGSSITGAVSGNTLTFTYSEPAASGEGEFVLAPDGNSFTGKWREQGKTEWQEWTGTRTAAEAGVKWLVVFESPWEESLAEPPYSFGEMLTAYFRRLPEVRVRVRVVNDRADFQRAARELPYLNGPVYLLLSGHGDNTGYLAGSDHISAAEISAAVNPSPNLQLLNFSACSVMAGPVPQQVLDALPAGRHLTISGYESEVDWGSSACLEMLYYDLIFAQDQAPGAAARLIQKELNFAGQRQTSGSPLAPLQFTFIAK